MFSTALRLFTFVLLLAAKDVFAAEIVFQFSWEFACSKVGENSTATLNAYVETDEFTEYSIQDSLNWGDNYGQGVAHTVAVGERAQFTYYYAYDEAGRYKVDLYSIWIAPDTSAVPLPLASHVELTDVAEDECFNGVETESPTITLVPTMTPSPTASNPTTSGTSRRAWTFSFQSVAAIAAAAAAFPLVCLW